ncbi:Heparan sulfate glucosamine 3-O-sulfotransferase 5 [Mactra antiquata]
MLQKIRQVLFIIALIASFMVGMLTYLTAFPLHRIHSPVTWQASEVDNENKAETEHEKEKTKVSNKTIVYDVDLLHKYDVDLLHKELLNIHNKLYKKQPNDQCNLREPACVVLGVAKSGTQELVDFASLHPNIVLKPGLANPKMFDKSNEIRMKAMLADRKYPVPCSHADQVVVFKSDDFLFKSEMPKILYEYNPNLKMILITREPVSRLISGYTYHYLQVKQRRERTLYRPELLPELDHHFVNFSSLQVIDNHESRLSMYYTGMENYLKVFPLNQILVLESNEFQENPVKVLQRVEKFLDIKSVITNEIFTFVEEKGFYCLNSDRIYCYGSDRGRKSMKDLKPETMEILKEHFKPHNMKFYEQIGKKFDW